MALHHDADDATQQVDSSSESDGEGTGSPLLLSNYSTQGAPPSASGLFVQTLLPLASLDNLTAASQNLYTPRAAAPQRKRALPVSAKPGATRVKSVKWSNVEDEALIVAYFNTEENFNGKKIKKVSKCPVHVVHAISLVLHAA